jgi:hypothetical protein
LDEALDFSEEDEDENCAAKNNELGLIFFQILKRNWINFLKINIIEPHFKNEK